MNQGMASEGVDMSEVKDYGNKWLNDPGDEVPVSEAEEFEACYQSGLKPENFRDKAEGERYRKWLAGKKK